MGQVGIEPSYYWFHIASISIAGSACLLVSFALFYMVYKIADLPFRFAYVSAGFFVVMLGLAQLSRLYGIWVPALYFEIFIDSLTALSGFTAAIMLLILIPRIVAVSKGRMEAQFHSLRLEQACEDLGVVVEKGGEEVRNYLRAIAAPTEVLLQGKHSIEDQKQLELIQKNADSLLRTIDGYFDDNAQKN